MACKILARGRSEGERDSLILGYIHSEASLFFSPSTRRKKKGGHEVTLGTVHSIGPSKIHRSTFQPLKCYFCQGPAGSNRYLSDVDRSQADSLLPRMFQQLHFIIHYFRERCWYDKRNWISRSLVFTTLRLKGIKILIFLEIWNKDLSSSKEVCLLLYFFTYLKYLGAGKGMQHL